MLDKAGNGIDRRRCGIRQDMRDARAINVMFSHEAIGALVNNARDRRR